MMKTIKVNGLGDLYDAAGEILDSLEGRTIVALRGEMGAGKTTLSAKSATVWVSQIR